MNTNEILDSPDASYWLKNAIRTALHRDIVDAARDAETLSKILTNRMNEAFELNPNTHEALERLADRL